MSQQINNDVTLCKKKTGGVYDYMSAVVIGSTLQSNVVQMDAAFSGEEHCVTTLRMAAWETR